MAVEAWVSRSGYTGEDGYEISVPEQDAEPLARALLAQEHVQPIGLGARDSYALKRDCVCTAMTLTQAPPLSRARSPGLFRKPGALAAPARAVIPARRSSRTKWLWARAQTCGPAPSGRAPMRDGVPLFETDSSETQIGTITSGGFGPTAGGPVAMGYVAAILQRRHHALR